MLEKQSLHSIFTTDTAQRSLRRQMQEKRTILNCNEPGKALSQTKKKDDCVKVYQLVIEASQLAPDAIILRR